MLRYRVSVVGRVTLATLLLAGCGGGGVSATTGTLGSISNPSSPATSGNASTGWSAPATLYAANNLPSSGAQSPLLAVDTQGDLVAAWLQGMDTNGDVGVFVSRYLASTSSWSTPLQVDTASRLGISASSPALVMDSAGNATLTWIQNTAQQIPALWAVHFAVTNASLPPLMKVDQSLSTGAGSSQAVLSVEGTDQAIVAWTQDEGTGNFIKLSAYAHGVWSSPQDVASPVSQVGSPSFPQVTSDTSGHVTLVWLQPQPTLGSLSVAARQWQQGSFTSALAYVDTLTLPGSGASAPLAVTDSAGNVDVVWIQGVNNASTGIVPALYSSVLAAGAAQWSPPREMDVLSGSGGSGHAQMVADASGNTWVVWEQATADIASLNHLYVKAVSASSTWVSPVLINTGVLFPSGVGVTAGPLLTVDDLGNQNVSWVTADPVTRIPVVYNSQRPVSTGLWTAPAQVNTTGYYAQGVTALATAVAPASGMLYALWLQFNSLQNQVYYSHLP